MGVEKELNNLIKKKVKNFPRALVLGLQWVSVGYSSALYFAGKKIGKDIAAKDVKGEDPKAILKEVAGVFKGMGIGSLSVKSIEEKKAVLVLKSGVTAHGMTPVGKSVCFFEAGLISGMLEGKLKKSITVTETRCGGLGHPEEEFMVKL